MIELSQETYTKAEVQSLLQSETDKVAAEYSEKLKAAEAERDALKPKEKPQAELDLEARAAALSKREREFACKEMGLDTAFADLLREDADLSKLSELLAAVQGYEPVGHKKTDGLTKEAFQAMSYSEQAALYAENPSIFAKLL